MRIENLLFASFVTLLIYGCKKPDNSPPVVTPPGDNSQDIIPRAAQLDTSRNILLLGDKAINDITVLDDSTLQIGSLANITNLNRPSMGPQPVSAINLNDFLVSDRSSKFGNGLLAAITSIKPGANGSSIAQFANVGIDSLYKLLDFDRQKSFDTLQLKDGFNIDIPVGPTKLNIQGNYQLFLTSGVSVKIENATFKKAECKVEGDIIFKAKSTLSLQTLQKDTTITLKTVPLFQRDNLSIGKVKLPFVLNASLNINLKVKASGTMQLSASYEYRNITYVGLVYDGSLKPEGAFMKDSVNKMDKTSKLVGTFSAGLEAQLKLGFFNKNKTGITASLSLKGVLEGDCADAGLSLTAKRVIEGDIGGEIELFSFPPLSGSVPIFTDTKTIFSTIIDDGGLCSAAFPSAPGKGGSHGDAHLWTPDGKVFDFQSFGEFTVVKDDQLLIQARQGAINTDKRVTFNKAIAVSEGPDTVEFQTSPLKLYVQGKEYDYTKKVYLSGRGYVESQGNQVFIRLSNGDYIAITYSSRGYLDYQVGLVDSHRGKISGLLGNWDGNPGNDLVMPDGSYVNGTDFKSMYPGFANAWRISNSNSIFYYEAGKSTAEYTDYSYPSIAISLTAAQIATAENACALAGVISQPALNNCTEDLGVMGDPAYAESALAMQDSFHLTDPVLWLPLDGDSKDKSPYGNDASISGQYSYTTNRKGKANSAITFNGKAWIDVPNTLTIKNLTGTITVSGWILVTKYDAGWAPFICKSYGNQANPFQVVLTTNSISGYPTSSPLAAPLTLNVWHHVAMVLDGGIKTYYVDGVGLGSQSDAININEGDLLLGSDPFGSQEYLYGALDDIRIYNRALSKADILNLMNE